MAFWYKLLCNVSKAVNQQESDDTRTAFAKNFFLRIILLLFANFDTNTHIKD
jgi:hypothetical protein